MPEKGQTKFCNFSLQVRSVTQCLKIAPKVAFNIKNLENLKLAVKQNYQTGDF